MEDRMAPRKEMMARVGFAAIVAVALGQHCFAQTGGAPAKLSDAQSNVTKARDLFVNYGCGGCHTLADAGSTGYAAPSFDEAVNLTESFIIDRVANGQGEMPGFRQQLSKDDITAIAAYVMRVRRPRIEETNRSCRPDRG
jgi:mono/diheme cytochrome c family protein